jgi:uncharacterized protein YdaU (DUF1376 family)
MGERAPAFSFYAKDFLLGTMTLSLAQRGGYITLLAYQWDHGSIPNDAPARAQILSCSKREEAALWAVLSKKFPADPDGHYRNARLELERSKQADRRDALAENGKKGGRPPKNQTETNRFPEQEPNGNQKQSLPLPSPSPFPVPSSNPDPNPRETRARTAPIHASHRNHAACGRVCVPAGLHNEFVQRRNHLNADQELRAWYPFVDREWAVGGPRERDEPGDVYSFWRARYAERWPSVGGRSDSRLPKWARDAKARAAPGTA